MMKNTVQFFMIVLLFGCSQEKLKWDEKVIKTSQNYYSLTILNTVRKDTLLSLSIDFNSDSLVFYQSKEIPLGIALGKSEHSSVSQYHLEISELENPKGGVFKSKLVTDYFYNPNRKSIKETFINTTIEIKRDSVNNVELLSIPELKSQIWPYIIQGDRFNLNEDDYSLIMYAKDKNGVRIEAKR